MEFTQSIPHSMYTRVVDPAVYAMQRSEQGKVHGNNWSFPSNGEVWEPEQTSDHVIQYTRRTKPGAQIKLMNLQVSTLGDIKWSEPVKINERIEGVELFKLRLNEGEEFERTITHSFEEVKTVTETAKVGLSLALKTSLNYTPGSATGGVGGGVDFTAEVSASYENQQSTQKRNSNSITQRYKRTGPFRGSITVQRSRTDLEVTTEVQPLFDGQVQIIDNGNVIYQWASLNELNLVLQGKAPTDRALAIQFVDNPQGPASLRAANRQRLPKVYWVNRYSDVGAIEIMSVPEDLDN